MQQIYRRTPMPKCDFSKVALQLYWNHTSTWVFSCKFAAYFLNTFAREHLWGAASEDCLSKMVLSLFCYFGLNFEVYCWKFGFKERFFQFFRTNFCKLLVAQTNDTLSLNLTSQFASDLIASCYVVILLLRLLLLFLVLTVFFNNIWYRSAWFLVAEVTSDLLVSREKIFPWSEISTKSLNEGKKLRAIKDFF